VIEHKLSKAERNRVEAVLQAVGDMSKEEARLAAEKPQFRFVLKHNAKRGSVALTMEDECDGTMALLGLVYRVLDALSRGEVLLVDELEASMHPDLARALITLFLDPRTNTASGQLVCATHNTHLLNTPGLRRDCVWFTEKTRHGATTLYPLTDFHTRKNASIETGYLQGRFGAVPLLGDFGEVVRAVARGSET
jgi:predicted ATPase